MTNVLNDKRVRRFLSLVSVLSQKNFQTRYRRTALGMVWVVIQPALQATVVALVFQKLFKGFKIEHYPLFVLSGTMVWAFTARSLGAATTSIIDNASLVKKVSVSRLIYPLSALGGGIIVHLASVAVIIGGGIGWRTLDVDVALLPLAVFVQLLVILGPSILASALYVTYRDVRYLVESGLLILFYATPVIYPLDRLGPTAQSVLRWNPMTGVLTLYRASVLDVPVDWGAVTISLGFAAITLAIGLRTFHRRAAEFADLS